jgi:hypothetical protein
MAKALLKAKQYDPNDQAYRVHTKGLGLVCINEKGISNNELIHRYLGEIYEPWRWFEK